MPNTILTQIRPFCYLHCRNAFIHDPHHGLIQAWESLNNCFVKYFANVCFYLHIAFNLGKMSKIWFNDSVLSITLSCFPAHRVKTVRDTDVYFEYCVGVEQCDQNVTVTCQASYYIHNTSKPDVVKTKCRAQAQPGLTSEDKKDDSYCSQVYCQILSQKHSSGLTARKAFLIPIHLSRLKLNFDTYLGRVLCTYLNFSGEYIIVLR